MPSQIKIELTPEAQETLRMVESFPENILFGIARAMGKENQLTVSHIQRTYLAFPRNEPSTPIGLRNMTGRYLGSLNSPKPVINGQTVESSIGSNVVSKGGVSYPAVHEFGATIPAHDVVAKGGALKFKIGDRVLFRKKVHVPEIVLPARAPIKRGIRDRLDDYGESISAEVQKIWEGK